MVPDQKVWDWRGYILRYGPESPTYRHVLLTLSCYMDSAGGSCFPSIDTLCDATKLSRPSVVQYLQKAKDDGWVITKQHGFGDSRWRRNEYTASIPVNLGHFHWGKIPITKPASQKEKTLAQRRVTNALYQNKTNKLVKKPCVVCGELEVEAHHYDYSKPLSVYWICRKHHLELHRAEKKGIVVNEVNHNPENGSKPDGDGGKPDGKIVVKEVNSISPLNNSPKNGDVPQLSRQDLETIKMQTGASVPDIKRVAAKAWRHHTGLGRRVANLASITINWLEDDKDHSEQKKYTSSGKPQI